ncbi:uncharacterized protein Tco025E_09147 [Trypanosoma conorhini]|uniref:Trans-sialidase n=1 Tax=Trypanosoma conorhini TaxID=83891 RepID=A0A3R7N2A4_9TRYP|nr:uncharacterized protein Tco025E_09147 [Trypanosoma conorhini]RNE98888.1 hypothetical protein Tco025E_09147 [Trypanosoma conorhini]
MSAVPTERETANKPTSGAEAENRAGATDAGAAVHGGGANQRGGAGAGGDVRAKAAGATDAASALASRKNGSEILLQARNAEDGSVRGRRALLPLLLLGLWVFATL